MRVGVGADEFGYALKEHVRNALEKDARIHDVTDFGVRDPQDHDPYPNVGLRVAEAVARNELDRAILICGTGIGMAITANKVPGVRATVAYDAYSVERSVLSNNCQILALGGRVITPDLAERIVRDWLGYTFDPASPSARKIAVISEYEGQ